MKRRGMRCSNLYEASAGLQCLIRYLPLTLGVLKARDHAISDNVSVHLRECSEDREERKSQMGIRIERLRC